MDDEIAVNGWPDTIWLTAQQRKDRDEAVFGELSFDITDAVTVSGGMRWFKANNSLKGFFGYGDGFSGSTGVSQCFSDEEFHGAPCTNLDKRVSERDSLGKVNVTWQIDDTKMVYATWSQGYRPGGINRRGTLPPYTSDFLTNYELGWKTTWGNAFVFNGALFRADWEDFQFSYLGQNGLTEIRNANSAQVDGLELDLSWAASYNLQISGGFAWYDARLTRNYCGWIRPDGEPETVCPPGTLNPNGDPVDGPQAASGTRLPITPRFKGALNARYTWDLAGGEAYWQASASHVGNRRVDLREAETALLGTLDAYTTADVSVGWSKDSWSIDLFLKNAFDERAEMSRFAQCAALTCGNQPYTVIAQPRTFGLRFSKSF
jgi:outer membrane receptor protein involved in Fe transport